MNLPINQIIEGDCLEVLKVLPDKSIDCIITDPPYNISQDKVIDITYIKNRKLRRKGKVRVLNYKFFENDNKPVYEYLNWLKAINIELFRVAKDSCSLYLWCPKSEVSFIEYDLKEIGWHVRSILVWCKTNPVPQIFKVGFMSGTEFCIFATKHKGAKHIWNIKESKF